MKLKLMFVFIFMITFSYAQQPTMEQTLGYLNTNITDLSNEGWIYEEIGYDRSKNTITIEYSGSTFNVNMNKEYEVELYEYDEKSFAKVFFKTESIKCLLKSDGDKFYKSLFIFSNAIPKTTAAFKHLLKLAYANRDKTYDSIKF